MKTKTTSAPFTSLVAIAAVCLSVGTAWTAHAQSTPTPTPTDLFASINLGGGETGTGAIFRYTPTGVQSTFVSNLDAPRGLAFDSAGNLFVANNTIDDLTGDVQGTIFKITPGGLMSTFATGFPANFFLAGLVMDSAGNVFVMGQSDPTPFNPSSIFKVTLDGTVSTFGTNPGISGGLAFDSAGNLFAADIGDKTIYKYTPDGVQSIFVTNTPGFIQSGGGPFGLAFDGSGNLFASTANSTDFNNSILEFTPDGVTETIIATGLNNLPRSIAFDSTGNLFLAERGNYFYPSPPGLPGDILKFPADGSPSATFASGIGIHGNRGPDFLAFAPLNTSIVSTVTTAVTLTFPEGTSPGTTTVTAIASPSPMPSPSEFQLGNPPLAFDITTTVTLPTTTPPPQIIIAFQVPQSFLDQCGCDISTLRVLHGTALDDVTCPVPNPGPTPNTTTNTIYASVSSLSPFVVAKLRYRSQVQQPINADGTSVFSVRRGVVPVKFTLTQDGTSTCTLPPATIALTRTSGGTTGAVDESVYSGSADTGSNFRISSCQYIYNLSASALGVGTYRADIKINGTVVGNATFQLK